MEYHGFGRKTFRFETDTTGKAVVHHVKGKFKDAYYLNAGANVRDEIFTQFDGSKNIFLLALDISSQYLSDTEALAGYAIGGSLSGWALIHVNEFRVADHELGHAFGLMHDTRSNAKLASGHEDPSVKMRTPSLGVPPYGIRLQFEIADPDGLHQAQLFAPFGGYPSVIACKRLNGKRTTVEFVTTELIGGYDIILRVIDLHGNFTEHWFPIDIAPLLPLPEVISIPDPNLAAAVRDTLSLAPSDAITQLDMLGLTDLWDAANRQITDLTGLEHALYIRGLGLWDNQIHDITQLAGLTKLWFLSLSAPLAAQSKIRDITPLATLKELKVLYLSGHQIADITPLVGLTYLGRLDISHNQISDVRPLAGLMNLTWLYLKGNAISDLSPLVANTGLGNADSVEVSGNPLNYASIYTHIPALQEQGVEVTFDNRTPQKSRIVLDDDQEGLPGEALAKPFVVEILDQTGDVFEGVPIMFSVVNGGGTLSVTNVTTDSNGRAESTLTLGPNPGTNTVTVSVTGITRTETFTAEGIRVPKGLEIVSGDDQEGQPGTALENPFIVEVRDQSDKPLPDVQVTFSVTSGGSTLSATSITTDSNGRTESILTLGPNPGTNTVEVGVRGIQEKQSVSAIAELPPIPQDVNRDDVVNILDLVFVASALGDEGQGLVADVNGDGIVNILDLVSVAGALGDVAAAPSANPRALAMLTAADVRQWLAQAQQLDLMDATSQRGVLFLEQLLTALNPKETALLPNYPNPFNPETWIPYQLAREAEVTLTIYDTNGIVVRRQDFGHKSAGFYESRSDAIYWDGRNDFGEGVASGVYFYHLSAGGYSAARKMLIIK